MEASALKKALRKSVLATLRGVRPEQRAEESKHVMQHLVATEWYRDCKHVSVFLGLNDEVDTMPIVQDLFARGRCVYVPRYEGPSMQMLRVRDMADLESLPKTKWNIPQPASAEGRDDPLVTGTLDLVLTPGVAFTAACDRLGRGAGYYDRFFDALKSSYAARGIRRPAFLALALSPQIVDSLPTTPHDVPLDAVVTPGGVLRRAMA